MGADSGYVCTACRGGEPVGGLVRQNRVKLSKQLRQFALERDGVVTAAEADVHGLDNSALRRLVGSGDWVREAYGIYRLADHPVTPRSTIRIAVLRMGGTAILSGLGAAYWHGVANSPPATVTVTATPGGHVKRVPGVRAVRRRLDGRDAVERSHLMVTGLPLSVLEGAVEGDVSVLDRALLLRRVSERQLRAVYDRRRGTVGATAMGRLLEGVGSGARSSAERLTVGLFESAGITGWIANYSSGRYIIDFAFVAERVAVGIDGMAYHRDADAFQNDRTRRNDLIAAGWTVLNFTWNDLVNHPDDVIARVVAALSAAASTQV